MSGYAAAAVPYNIVIMSRIAAEEAQASATGVAEKFITRRLSSPCCSYHIDNAFYFSEHGFL